LIGGASGMAPIVRLRLSIMEMSKRTAFCHQPFFLSLKSIVN
jgi:hypothetical protein